MIEGLESIAIEFFIHIPDSFGAPVIAHFEDRPRVRCFPVAKEEEGIGIASGLAMAGKRAVLFYQDTGLGNSIGALTTYAMAYHAPMLVLAIRRGGFGEFNAANFHFSEAAIDMVETMRIKAFVLDYRVPLEQSLQLFTHLQRRGVKSKFLYFPDEGHWIAKPQNSQLWYKTVHAWLAEHLKE